ncbi:MAG: LppP/LprE family lipoprotein [Thermomicrobiales bacterium]
MRQTHGWLAIALVLVFCLAPAIASAQGGSWLDQPLTNWNAAGMALPSAPQIDGNTDPRCSQRDRPAETDEDQALIANGWRLFGSFQRGWSVTVVSGYAASDGMCRPLGYQWFVFVDGQFAGTIAPQPMDSRTDGSGRDVHLWYADQLSAEFSRYTADDPLCCPSGSAAVDYRIDNGADGPVLVPASVS